MAGAIEQRECDQKMEAMKEMIGEDIMRMNECDRRMSDFNLIYAEKFKTVDLLMKTSQEALKLATTVSAERMDSHNNLIAMMEKQAHDFPTRAEIALMLEPLQQQAQDSRDFITSDKAHASLKSVYIIGGVTAINLIIGVITLLLRFA
jgi:hypothetical protein